MESGGTYVAGAVVLDLYVASDRFDGYADCGHDYASTEDCVDCSARQVVLQHVSIALVGSVR